MAVRASHPLASPALHGCATRGLTLCLSACPADYIGWLNPTLYHPSSAHAFHDITDGANTDGLNAVCAPSSSPMGFGATVGWDPVSGLGSVDYGLFAELYATYSPMHNCDGSELTRAWHALTERLEQGNESSVVNLWSGTVAICSPALPPSPPPSSPPSPPAPPAVPAVLPSMSTVRSCLGVGVLGNVLYAIGGQASSSYLRSMEIYDPSTNAWRTGPSMSTGRCNLGVGVLGSLLYAVGGESLRTMEMYDPSTNVWRAGPSMATTRSGLGVGVLGNLLYAVGGRDGTAPYVVSTMEVYDPSTNAWCAGPSMAMARTGLGVGVLGGLLYAVGGYDNNNYLSSMEVYDPSTNTWRGGPSMAAERFGLGVGVLGGQLFAIAGQNRSTEVYDPSTNVWRSGPSMAIARDDLGVGVLDNVLYAIGGESPRGYLSSMVAYAPLSSSSWTGRA